MTVPTSPRPPRGRRRTDADYAKMGRACEAAGLARFGEMFGRPEIFMQPPRDLIRRAALEEAAKIADSFADQYDPATTPYQDGYQNAAMFICEAIRALGEKV